MRDETEKKSIFMTIYKISGSFNNIKSISIICSAHEFYASSNGLYEKKWERLRERGKERKNYRKIEMGREIQEEGDGEGQEIRRKEKQL